MKLKAYDGQHTNNWPVINATMLENWRKSSKPDSNVNNIHLSAGDPGVFANFVGAQSVVICRKEISPAIVEFVTTALDRIGVSAAMHLRYMWKTWDADSKLYLDANGILYCGTTRVDPQMIVDMYKRHGIDPNTTESFALFYTESTTAILEAVPQERQPKLIPFTVPANCNYNANPDVVGHYDANDTAFFHVCNPTTAYPYDAYPFMVQAGDLVAHGRGVKHRFSSLPPESDGTPRPRFLPVLRFEYAQHL